MCYRLCMHDGRFSKCSHFSNIYCFFERFFARSNCKWFEEWILAWFLEFEFLSQSEDFIWDIAFAYMMADFQNALISRIFTVSLSGFFARNNCKWFVEWILTCFLEFEFLNQSEDFTWAIAFAYIMADFQNALISRIFSFFFGGVVCAEQL